MQFRRTDNFSVFFNSHTDSKNENIKAEHQAACTKALSSSAPGLPFSYQGVPYSLPAFVAAVASVFGVVDDRSKLAVAPPILTLEALAFCSFKV